MFCVTPSDLICDVPLTRHFNIAAADGNAALHSLHNYKVVHICCRLVSLFVTKHFTPPHKAVSPTSVPWCFRVLVSLQTRTGSSLTSKKYYRKNIRHNSCLQCNCNCSLSLTDNWLWIWITFCHSVICRAACLRTVCNVFRTFIGEGKITGLPSVIDHTGCTVLSFCYRPYRVYSPFLLL
jgi:hypothetical protein